MKLEFSPDDRYLAAVGESHVVVIWDTTDGSAIHTRVHENKPLFFSWGDIITDANPKHPSYVCVVGFNNQVNINTLEFDIASMQYFVKEGACQLPNTGLIRNYTFSLVNGDMLMAGTQGGEICLFSIYS